jgi:WD40 repeat protein
MNDNIRYLTSLTWNPDSKRITSASKDNITIWDAETGKAITRIEMPEGGGYAKSLAWDHQGKYLLYCEKGSLRVWDADNSLYFYRRILTLEGHEDVWIAVWSPDDNSIASASRDGIIKLWERKEATFRVCGELKGHKGHVGITDLFFNNDGNFMICGYRDNSVLMWNVRTGRKRELISGKAFNKKYNRWHRDYMRMPMFNPNPMDISSLALNPDGNRLLTGHCSWNHDIKIWDAKIKKETAALSGGKSEYRDILGITDVFPSPRITIVGWSPDGKKFFSAGSDTLKVWDGEKKWELKTFSRHTRAIDFASWSPDGRYIVSAAINESIRVWDIEKGQVLKIE